MAKILIRDLVEDTTLDRKAMRAIAGGARRSGRGGPVDSVTVPQNTIKD